MVHFHQQAGKPPKTSFSDASVGVFHGDAAEIRDGLFVSLSSGRGHRRPSD